MNRSASRTLLQLGALGTLAAGSSAWAATVQLKLDLPRLNVAEYHRPYVAVWVEKAGESGPAVAQLAVWYDIKKQNNAVLDVSLDGRWQVIETSIADMRRKLVAKYKVDF